MTATLEKALKLNDYPGRGLVVARTGDGALAIAYFLTGRSDASRARALVREGDDLFARPTDDTAHDPLRHYRAVSVGRTYCVVGNGDQVDQITRHLADSPAVSAVQGVEFEPDPPLRTPRITVVAPRRDDQHVVLTRAYASTLAPERTIVSTWTVSGLDVGHALIATTYESRKREVKRTDHAPLELTTDAASPEDLRDRVWGALPKQLRVACAVVAPHWTDPLQVEVRSA